MGTSDNPDPWDLVLSSPIRDVNIVVTGPEEFVNVFVERLKQVKGVGFTKPAEHLSRRKLDKKLPNDDIRVRLIVTVVYDS